MCERKLMSRPSKFTKEKSKHTPLDVVTLVLLVGAIISVLGYTLYTYNSNVHSTMSELSAAQLARAQQVRINLTSQLTVCKKMMDNLANSWRDRLISNHTLDNRKRQLASLVGAITRSNNENFDNMPTIEHCLGVFISREATIEQENTTNVANATDASKLAKEALEAVKQHPEKLKEPTYKILQHGSDLWAITVSSTGDDINGRVWVVVIWRLKLWPDGKPEADSQAIVVQVAFPDTNQAVSDAPGIPNLLPAALQSLKKQRASSWLGRLASLPGTPAFFFKDKEYIVSGVSAVIGPQRVILLAATPSDFFASLTAPARRQASLISLVLLITLAALAASLIKTRVKYFDTQSREEAARFQSNLNEVTAACLDSNSLEELAETLAKGLPKLLYCSSVGLWYLKEEELVRVGKGSGAFQQLAPVLKPSIGDPLHKLCHQDRTTVVLQTSATPWEKAEEWQQAGLRSLLLTPLNLREDCRMVLIIGSDVPFAYGKQELRLMKKLRPVLENVLLRLALKEETEEAKSWLGSLLEQSSSAICALDELLRITLWNARAAEITGLSQAEVLHKHISEVPFLASAGLLARVKQVAKGRLKRTSGVLEYRKGEEQGWLQYSISTLERPSGERALLLSFTDVTTLRNNETEARQAHAFLERVLENSQAAIIVFNADGSVRSQNTFARQLSERRHRTPGKVGEKLGVLFHKLAAQVLKEKQPLQLMVEFEQAPAGVGRLSVGCSLITDTSGVPEGVVLVAADVTELYELRERLAAMEKSRIIAELAAGVAHDFNNVLASIMGNAELALALDDPARQREWLEQIVQAAEEGATSVRRLQEFASVRKDLHLAKISVAELINTALNLTKPLWQDQAELNNIPLNFTVEVEPGLPPVYGDESSLQQMLVNLVLNAIEAMPAGGELKLSARRRGREVEITLSDSGVGMAPETLQHAREPFFSTKGHAGLGLAVSHGIARRHGGRLRLKSKLGKGTTVIINLPLDDEASRKQGEAKRPAEAPAHLEPVRTAKIAVVEDLAGVRRVLRETLTRAGYELVEFGDPLEALEWARKADFDLLLTDLGMPNLSGLDLAREIHAVKPDLPIVMVTGWGEQLSEAEVREAGVQAVLSKPYRSRQLIELIASCLDGKR